MTADDMSDDSYLLISGYSFENGEYCAYMIMDGADRAYDSDFASSFIDTYYDMYSDISPSTDGYSYSAEYRDVVVEGTAFRGVLITTTRDDGTVTYKLVFIIGDDDKYYIVTVDGNMELVDSFGSCFTYC